ncbi:site-specific integrase [Luteibacter sp. CQ10]|uniref:site-specific integrase n=1 Tax=Luteibacter sp. CQ10 TaxID=2805821 RepID=UPI0034A46CAC
MTRAAPPAGRPVADYLEASTRQNTQRSYAAGVRHFEETWGGLLPATPQRVAEYLATYGETQSINTLRSRLAALAHWHYTHGFADPTRHPLVRQTLKGIREIHNVEERRAEPLQLRDLARLDTWMGSAVAAADACGDTVTRLRTRRDRALILLGFWKGFRGDELLGLRFEHVTLLPTKGMTLYLPRSKSDRQSVGVTHRVPALSRLCPVTALEDWRAATGLVDGPVFRAIDARGSVRAGALHANSLIGVLRRAFARAGLPNATHYTSHSLRRGFAGWASGNGWDARALMEYVGWKDIHSAMRYVDAPDVSGRERIEAALALPPAPPPAPEALPAPSQAAPLSTFAVSLVMRWPIGKARRATTQALRTIEFICLQRHAAVAQDPGKTHFLLNVLAHDELELSEVMATLIEDIHRIAGNHGVTVDTVAQHDDGRLRWD